MPIALELRQLLQAGFKHKKAVLVARTAFVTKYSNFDSLRWEGIKEVRGCLASLLLGVRVLNFV